jgi:hypothetical protein
MNETVFAVFGAIGGALLTAMSAVAVSYYQRVSAARDTHLLRAFEHHLTGYEHIFMTCSVLDSLNDYSVISGRVSDRSDPFLSQLLDALQDLMSAITKS